MMQELKITKSPIDDGLPILLSGLPGLNLIQLITGDHSFLNQLRIVYLHHPPLNKLPVFLASLLLHAPQRIIDQVE